MWKIKTLYKRLLKRKKINNATKGTKKIKGI